ncbi:MAG: PaaI family thioesterase [Thermoanaerobaculia bacterium]
MAPGLKASNPQFEAVVRASFSRQTMMTSLGATLTLVEPGRIHVRLPRSAKYAQQHGFMHAGAIASIADSACGYAALTLAPPDTEVLAVEFKINLLEPARAGLFEARAQVVRQGRTLSSCMAEVLGVDEGEETLVATMMSTIIQKSGGSRGAAFREQPPVQ